MTDVVVELTVVGGPDKVELAAADLWAAGATAVQEVAPQEAPVQEVAGKEVAAMGSAAAGGPTTLVASFPTAEAARVVAAEVGATVVEITDTSWQDRWRDFARPVDVGPDLVIAPAWRDVAIPPAGPAVVGEVAGTAADGRARLVVRIDPGPCFGSGSHPSTRLILGLVMARGSGGGLAGRRILDVGCGSGILSVTAARLGATVTAVDVDDAAVAYTEANAAANGVAALVHASSDTVTVVAAAAAAAGSRGFDMALVNVTAGVHAVVGAATSAAVRPEGTLLLAGLLPGQWRHVADAYPSTEVTDLPTLDGWEGVILTRT